MTTVLITLGSNLNKEANLPAAVHAMATHPQMTLMAVSPVYETAPMGRDGRVTDQPAFFNAAAQIETTLAPAALRAALRAIEATLGRVRTDDKFAARPIDLDIALYGARSVQIDGTIIPDPDVMRFAHVAIPLADIAPHWRVPPSGRTMRQIADSLDTAAHALIKNDEMTAALMRYLETANTEGSYHEAK